MKLEIGKGSYQIRTPISSIKSVVISDKDGGHGAFKVLLAKVTLADIIAYRERDLSFGSNGVIEMPQYYCLNANWLEIWPRPDKAYDADITYYPPPCIF